MMMMMIIARDDLPASMTVLSSPDRSNRTRVVTPSADSETWSRSKMTRARTTIWKNKQETESRPYHSIRKWQWRQCRELSTVIYDSDYNSTSTIDQSSRASAAVYLCLIWCTKTWLNRFPIRFLWKLNVFLDNLCNFPVMASWYND